MKSANCSEIRDELFVRRSVYELYAVQELWEIIVKVVKLRVTSEKSAKLHLRKWTTQLNLTLELENEDELRVNR